MASTYYSRAESYSRSYNAMEAKRAGRMPLTRAAKYVAAEAGVTQKAAKVALQAVHDGEWHHVGKYATRVDYYDVAAALDVLMPARLAEREVRAVLADALAAEFESEREWENAWEVRGKVLRVLGDGLRAWGIPSRSRLIVFGASDEEEARQQSCKWGMFGRELPVVELHA